MSGLTHVPVQTARVAAFVLERYALAGARVIGALTGSKRNDNYVVEDRRGERYVLRQYRRNPNAARIHFQLRFQQHLLASGIPTSRPVESSDGALLVVDGSNLYALFTYVSGAEYDFTMVDQAREAARWLARFHVAGSFFACGAYVDVDTIPDVRRWWTGGEEELARLERAFVGRGVESELAFLRGWQRKLIEDWPLERLDALPTAWVHGDYHGRNMTFARGRLQGLFDFDVVHRGFRVEDIGYGMLAFARERRGSHRLRREVARIFLGEYGRSSALRRDELDALPTIGVVVHARRAPQYALRERLGEDAAQALKEHVSLMRALRNQLTVAAQA